MNVNRHEYAWTTAGRMYWNLRNRLGQFVNRAGYNASRIAAQHDAWRAYLDARRDDAERATNGNVLAVSARARGVSAERLFSPGASLTSASDELRDWFHAHGPTLRRAEFIAQCAA